MRPPRAHDSAAAKPAGAGDEGASPLIDLIEVMQRLRRDCPWDAEQTHHSLAPYLLEESHEVLEALSALSEPATSGEQRRSARALLHEELGDLLLQIYFHATLAHEEDASFTVESVAAALIDKLVYRHPHVFADVSLSDAAAVERSWDELKAAEKQRTSVLDGIPATLPALQRAQKTLGRLAKAGREPLPVDDGIGAALLDLVKQARAEGVDAEQALSAALRVATGPPVR